MDGWKVNVLSFSVIVDEWWNGKCLRNEMSCISGEAMHIAGAP